MTFKQIKIEAQKKFYIEEFFLFRAARMRMGNFQIGQIVNQNCKPYHNCYLHARPLTIRVFFFWCTFFFSLSSMAVLRLPNWKMLMLTHAVVVVLSLSEKKYSYNGQLLYLLESEGLSVHKVIFKWYQLLWSRGHFNIHTK